jgi:hypothetical protein
MESWVLWLIALYGLTTAWIQLHQWLHCPKDKEPVQFLLYTYNSQGKVEWIIRSLSQLAKLEGRSCQFYLIDSGSQDDTLKIIERLNKQHMFIHVLQEKTQEITRQERHMIHVDLRSETCAQAGYQALIE